MHALPRRLPLAAVLLGALVAARTVAQDPSGDAEVFAYDAAARTLAAEATEQVRLPRDPAPAPAVARILAAREALGAVVGDHASVDLGGGDLFLAWDEFLGGGDGFDVRCVRVQGGEVGPVRTLAGGPAFQARPSAAFVPGDGGAGGLWVAWEEGPEVWGETYRSVDRLWNNVTDASGPLHSWRTVRMARVDGESVREVAVPMPALAAAASDEARREGAARVGVYYERPEITAHGGALVLALRHCLQVQAPLRAPTRTHVESGFTVDVRGLDAEGFTAAARLDARQRDGAQRVRFAREGDALVLHAEVGRADRRPGQGALRVVTADLTDVGRTEARVALEWSEPRSLTPATTEPRPERTRRIQVADDRPFTLLFGDLHRHTDLSLCFPFYDGSLDDAYRYARGPAGLDFVAITDHARDLDRGDVSGVPWQRSLEAVEQSHRPGEFVAFYSYERSQAQTDHNVISLTPDVLAPHTPPLRDFWSEIDPSETITIPHATSHVNGKRFCGDVWTKNDPERRPLAEVYQSYRDVDSLEELRTKALATDQMLGFIASSDHLSTSGAYACVWAEGAGAEALERRPIFDALRARRTYGATARIELAVMTSGGAWMGEQVEAGAAHDIVVTATAPSPLTRVEFWTRAGLAHVLERDALAAETLQWSWDPEGDDECVVVVHTEAGERAWASPFFARAR